MFKVVKVVDQKVLSNVVSILGMYVLFDGVFKSPL